MPPLVSIIIPAYNYDRYVGRAIQSALDQTYPNREIIVVNDGSTDGTENVARGFEPAIRYICQANKGLAEARNTGIHHARGQFLVFLDADDWIEPHSVDKMVETIQRLPERYGIVACRHTSHTPAGVLTNRTHVFPESAQECDALWRDMVISNVQRRFMPFVLVKREVFENCGLFDDHCRLGSEDRDMWIRTLTRYNIRILPDRLLNYFIHGANMSSDPAKILPGMWNCIVKARNSGVVSRWNWPLWAQASAIFHHQASTLYRDIGNNQKALHHVMLSLLAYPFPLSARLEALPNFGRVKRLLLCIHRVVRGSGHAQGGNELIMASRRSGDSSGK